MNPVCSILVLAGRGEPYRILFPLGAALGVLGALLWPAFVYGWLPMYPGIPHSRIMVQGFVFSFVAGFLSSALPHMLEVKGLSLGHTLLLAMLIILVAGLQVVGFTSLGDALFSATVAVLLVMVIRRWPERKDLPPPGFTLAALGLISGLIGSCVLSLYGRVEFSPQTFLLAKLLLNHAFILFPVLGVGAYLLPRMAGLPNLHLISPKSRDVSSAWIRRALFMMVCGVFLLVSFGIESTGQIRAAYSLRAAVAMICLFHEVPLFRARKIRGSIPWALVIAAVSILTGIVVIAIWPMRLTTYLHIVFISGYGLLILNISARVVLGHSGNAELIYAKSRAVKWIVGLVLLAMATRVSADLIPNMQLSHYAYAGITWAIITVIWLMKFGPLLAEAPARDSA